MVPTSRPTVTIVAGDLLQGSATALVRLRGRYHVPVNRVLILDDREDYLRALQAALRKDFEVVFATSIEEASQLLDGTVQVALVDVRLSEQDPSNRDGLRFLDQAKRRYPGMSVIMMSAYRDVDAIETLDASADYFLRKPIDLRELRSLLREFAERGAMPEKTEELKRALSEEHE